MLWDVFFPKADKEDIILNFRSHDNSSYNHFLLIPGEEQLNMFIHY